MYLTLNINGFFFSSQFTAFFILRCCHNVKRPDVMRIKKREAWQNGSFFIRVHEIRYFCFFFFSHNLCSFFRLSIDLSEYTRRVKNFLCARKLKWKEISRRSNINRFISSTVRTVHTAKSYSKCCRLFYSCSRVRSFWSFICL